MPKSSWHHGLSPTRLLLGCPRPRILELGCHFLLQGISQPRDWTWVSCIAGRFFTNWDTRKALGWALKPFISWNVLAWPPYLLLAIVVPLYPSPNGALQVVTEEVNQISAPSENNKNACYIQIHSFSSVQLLSPVWLFTTPWITACQASLSITNSQTLLKLMSIESVMPSSHLNLCHPIPPSIRVFSNESTLRMRWPKYWSFSFSISPSNEHPGLISFRMDWLDLAVQGTLKSLLQHHSSKASILQTQLSLRSNSHIHTWLLEKP